jgi:hypothetical protein
MDSKIALEIGRSCAETKGQAENRMTVIQLTRTIIPPSCTDKAVTDFDLNIIHKRPPKNARLPAGKQKERIFVYSAGFEIRIRSGVSMTMLAKIRITPIEERMAA